MPSVKLRASPQAKVMPQAKVILLPTDDLRWILKPRGRKEPPPVSQDEPLRLALYRRKPWLFRRLALLQTSHLTPLEAALRQIPFAVELQECLPG